jgi:MCP family monocarboxylic acid transporter-like MFS transporter 14
LLSLNLTDNNALLRVLKEMVDVTLFLNPRFVLICLSNILGFLALYVPYVYLPSMIIERGMTMEQASFIVSAIGKVNKFLNQCTSGHNADKSCSSGISNTIGRVVLGWMVDFPWVSSLIVTNMSLVCSGICVLAFPFCHDFVSFIIVALMLGKYYTLNAVFNNI